MEGLFTSNISCIERELEEHAMMTKAVSEPRASLKHCATWKKAKRGLNEKQNNPRDFSVNDLDTREIRISSRVFQHSSFSP